MERNKVPDSSKNSQQPWKNGHYLGRPGFLRKFCFIEGNEFLMYPVSGKPSLQTKGVITYGNFGDVHPEVASATGRNHYNVEIFHRCWELRILQFPNHMHHLQSK